MSLKRIKTGVMSVVVLAGLLGYAQSNGPNSLTTNAVETVTQVPPKQATTPVQAATPITRTILLNSLTPGEWKVLSPYLPIQAGDVVKVRAEPAMEGSVGLKGPKPVGDRYRTSRQVADNTVGVRIGLNGKEVRSNSKGQFLVYYSPVYGGKMTADTDGNLYIAQFGSSPTRLFIEVTKKSP